VTTDFDTLDDRAVTVRERDAMTWTGSASTRPTIF
jgi:glycyl-tRNA synthetase (class II)